MPSIWPLLALGMRIAVQAYLWLRHCWLAVLRTLFQARRTQATILLVGDGLMEGCGDQRMYFGREAGPGGRLDRMLRADARLGYSERAVTVAKTGMCCQDWLKRKEPHVSTGTASTTTTSTGTATASTAHRRNHVASPLCEALCAHPNVHTVLIGFGETNLAFYSDAAAGQLVDEMESLVDAAVDLLATQVSSETNSKPALNPPETLERWERANVRLLEMVEARRTRGVRLGPNLHTFEYHWRRDHFVGDWEARASGDVYSLNDKGYDKFARDWFDLVYPVALTRRTNAALLPRLGNAQDAAVKKRA